MTRAELLALPVAMPLLTAGAAWGLGRDATYDLARRGELPFQVLALGRRKVVTRAALLDSLGLADDPAPAVPAPVRLQAVNGA